MKAIANILKYLSINVLIVGPNFHINHEIRKKRAARLTIEAMINIVKLMLQTPAVTVISLNGIGVNPAVNTTQKLYSSYIV